jgi:hypothetical protein
MKIQPFFSRYLETQNAATAATKLPGLSVTMRYPSDNEDDGSIIKPPSQAVTLKYPSDNEDGGSVKVPGYMTTMKYPSDGEDGGVNGPGNIVTLKFPSDNEDSGDNKCHQQHNNSSSWNQPLTGVMKNLQRLLHRFLNMFNRNSGAEPVPSNMVTLKYPSDQEDGGCR